MEANLGWIEREVQKPSRKTTEKLDVEGGGRIKEVKKEYVSYELEGKGWKQIGEWCEIDEEGKTKKFQMLFLLFDGFSSRITSLDRAVSLVEWSKNG